MAQDYKEVVESKRKAMLDVLLLSIESNPTRWGKGWISIDTPYNASTQKNYNGLNALFLDAKAQLKGYKDARWVTFNQAKELGASVKTGEKASDVFYWSRYDKATKKPFEEETVKGMTDEERVQYMKDNVRAVLKFYQVFNVEQCIHFPENTKRSTTMSDEERAHQNEQIENIIKNSAAPIVYDGKAYYSPHKDNIHLPLLQSFKSMQDYYATALHEIGHSTGHQSRLNRNLEGIFGSESYAIEELRAELASVFLQTELGIELGGAEIANHSAYLKSWLAAVRKDVNVFYRAAADAGKISDYIKDNYLKVAKERTQEENQSQNTEIKTNGTLKAKEIAEAKSIEEGRAYVVIEWSEHKDFKDNTVLTFAEADGLLRALNIQEAEADGYYKTKLHICCPDDKGEAEWYDNCRFDIGSEAEGGLIRHISDFANTSWVSETERAELEEYIRNLRAHAEPTIGKGDVNESIKEWYGKNYPGDDLARDISDGVTFQDLTDAIDAGADVYDTIGAHDSVVRERLFNHIAEINGMEYSEVYDFWMTKLEQADKFAKQIKDEEQAKRQAKELAGTKAIKEGRAYVHIEWSELRNLKANTVLPFTEADKILQALNERERDNLGYSKTYLNICCPKDDGTGVWYNGFRFDIGSEDKGGLIKHISNCASVAEESERNDLEECLDFLVSEQSRSEIESKEHKEKPNVQSEQVGQVEQARQVGQVRQVELVLPIESKMQEYGKATMFKMPAEVQFSRFVFLAPTRMLQADESTARLKVASNFEFTLKNDGREVKLTADELRTVLDGKEISKSAQRLAPARRNAERLEALRDNVPGEMKEMPNWCVYRTKWSAEKGKKEKFVLSVSDGKWAKINDRSTWSDFETAYKYALENNCEGLAFALDGSGITCIDLDKCIVKNGQVNGSATSQAEGELNDVAKKLVPALSDTYCERSASGNGLHFFLRDDILSKDTFANRAELPGGDEIEVYDNSRFISMTGDMFGKSKQSDKSNKLGKCPMQTMSWIRTALGAKNKIEPTQRSTQHQSSELRYQSDSEVLERIRRSKKGEQFDTLYSGGDITGDKSRDDLMMLNTLAFFTDCNAQQMRSIFESSARFRPESKNSAYVDRSIQKACDSLAVRFGQNRTATPAKGKK